MALAGRGNAALPDGAETADSSGAFDCALGVESFSMSTKRTTTTRRRSLAGLAGLGALVSSTIAAEGATSTLKQSFLLLSRKPGISHDEFVKHWVEIHAPLAYACPGISRYTVTIVKSSSTRKDVPALNVAIDGIAEMWFKDQAAMDALPGVAGHLAGCETTAQRSSAERSDFTAEEKVIIPR